MAKIVIDAGHGGRDSGAVYRGRMEKDDALALALHIGAEVHPAHVLHEDVQPGIPPGGQVQLPLLQKLPVVQCGYKLVIQQDVRPVVCTPEPDFFQVLLRVQRGAVKDVAVVLAQTLSVPLLMLSKVDARLTFSQASSVPYDFLRISVENSISGSAAYFPMTSR